jgi:two-component sensor histidine kinase
MGAVFQSMNRLYPLVLEHRLPSPIRYGISASIMVVCAVLQMTLQMQTGAPGYFPAAPGVFLSGLIFDRGSGIFAAIIAIGVGAYLSFAGSNGIDYLATNALFAITAAGTAMIAEFQRAELWRVMLSDKTKAVLLQEMAHRTKNNLAILGGMIRLEAGTAGQKSRPRWKPLRAGCR